MIIIKNIKIILLSFLFQIINIVNSSCNIKNCHKQYGECIEDICLCAAGYTTLEKYKRHLADNERIYCNYAYTNKNIATFYELLLPCGVGHLYARRYLNFFFKFIIFWFLSFNKVIFRKRILIYPKFNFVVEILMWIFSILYIVDFVCFQFNYYKDGQGMPML
jgi:hypothetical protein